jgi:glycosyltransferase involved in cell wall biosynthesis
MKKRILFIGGTKGGGVATINNEVIKIFQDAGYRCAVLDTKARTEKVPALPGSWELLAAGKYLFFYLAALGKIVMERPSAVYLQVTQTGYLHQSLFLLIAKLLRRETIAHFHAGSDFRGTCTKTQLRRILFSEKYTDKMIVLTEPSKESLSEAGWRGEIHVIPNFINAERLPADFRPACERSQLLYIGRMSREKGIFEVLEAAARLPEERFVFVGKFEEQRTQAEFARRLEQVSNARWLGPIYTDEKFRVIAESRLLIFPTRRDLFPLTLIESSILGCVPLVSKVGSVGEIIKDGYNGLYISPDDIEGMIGRITELRDGDKLQRLSDNGVEYARSHFTNRAVEKKLLEIVG